VKTGIGRAHSTLVSDSDRSKPYIDVMENVFGGVQISTESEPETREPESDLKGRPWLTGVSMTEVQVRRTDEEDEPGK
jgi:hypothetical protein